MKNETHFLYYISLTWIIVITSVIFESIILLMIIAEIYITGIYIGEIIKNINKEKK